MKFAIFIFVSVIVLTDCAPEIPIPNKPCKNDVQMQELFFKNFKKQRVPEWTLQEKKTDIARICHLIYCANCARMRMERYKAYLNLRIPCDTAWLGRGRIASNLTSVTGILQKYADMMYCDCMTATTPRKIMTVVKDSKADSYFLVNEFEHHSSKERYFLVTDHIEFSTPKAENTTAPV